MIDFEAFFKITYGLFIVSSGDSKRGNGFISNTVFQITADPPRFGAACNKNNFTAGFISSSGVFSVSVLEKETSPEILGRFGFRSGRDFDKLEGMSIRYGETGVPIVLNGAIAFLECRVVQTIDTGTHLLFIGELVQSAVLDNTKEPLTYIYYRQVKKGVSPKNAPTYIDKSKPEAGKSPGIYKKYRCAVCGYIYDEERESVRFSELPVDWICPVCGSAKSEFIEV
ncbi:MAG: flavin reductase [Bacteroidales bacterium]|jgi:flavin reductase (DIM6/NTAB) family NADH-FMN oxidoreductase RutF/rubredoxin